MGYDSTYRDIMIENIEQYTFDIAKKFPADFSGKFDALISLGQSFIFLFGVLTALLCIVIISNAYRGA